MGWEPRARTGVITGLGAAGKAWEAGLAWAEDAVSGNVIGLTVGFKYIMADL